MPYIMSSGRASFLATLALLSASIAGAESVHAGQAFDAGPGTTAGTLYLKSSPTAEVTEALRMSTVFRAQVTGTVARVHVVQTFSNSGDDWVEGLYVFPLSEDAAVDELHLTVGERSVQGVIQEKARAQATYAAAREAGRSASIVDQERPNMFTTAVANIAPHSAVSVEITYLETIALRDRRYTLRLPLAITPRYTPGARLNPADPMAAAQAAFLDASTGATATPERVTAPRQHVDIAVELAPGFAPGSVSSLHHAADIKNDGTGQAIVVSSNEAPADHDFELVWTPAIAGDVTARAFVERTGGVSYVLTVLTPPDVAETAEQPREVTFIIDTSGSMEGPSIEQARAALQLGIDRLQSADRFNVIRFASDYSSLFSTPRAVSDDSRRAARAFIAGLRADGGTEMRAPLERALEPGPGEGSLKQVIFITDGSVGNESELVTLIHERIGSARLFMVGIGAAPNLYFLKEAASAGRGSYTIIAQREQVASRMSDLFLKLEHPALVDLAVRWPGGVRADLAGALPGDVYAGDPVVLLARLDGGAGDRLTLTGRREGAAWSQQVPLVAVADTAGLSKLWARERIGDLSRRLQYGGDHDALRKAILDLALDHHLVSEFTSLVAVDDLVVRAPGSPGRVEQAPTSAPTGSYWQTAGFAKTATPSSLLVWCGLCLLSIGMACGYPRMRLRRAT